MRCLRHKPLPVKLLRRHINNMHALKRGSTEQQKSTADAKVAMAQAAVKEANALTEEAKLYSPVERYCIKTYGKPTELVANGVPVVSITEDHEMWVSLNVREDMYESVYQNKTLDGFSTCAESRSHI